MTTRWPIVPASTGPRLDNLIRAMQSYRNIRRGNLQPEEAHLNARDRDLGNEAEGLCERRQCEHRGRECCFLTRRRRRNCIGAIARLLSSSTNRDAPALAMPLLPL